MIVSNKTKCILILSSKSSGSSALQNFLSSYPHVNFVRKTRHFEHETLFWTKAASILGLSQIEMADSEVPIPKSKAKDDLMELLTKNIPSYIPPEEEEEMIFNGWRRLCESHSPVFIEKSPHHLYQWAALRLIVKCIYRQPEIEYMIVGLVRNPMAFLYSMWNRYGSSPDVMQYQWFKTYSNLLGLKSVLGEKLLIIRYEDIISDILFLKDILNFIGAPMDQDKYSLFHRKSLEKWKEDPLFKFKPSQSVINLANKYDYSLNEAALYGSYFWPLCKYAHNKNLRIGKLWNTLSRIPFL
jgi:hypothetical protein